MSCTELRMAWHEDIQTRPCLNTLRLYFRQQLQPSLEFLIAFDITESCQARGLSDSSETHCPDVENVSGTSNLLHRNST
jgi:uncharacterized membrane protein